MLLEKYQKEIAALNPLELGCTFYYDKWLRHFSDKTYLECVLAYNNHFISRQTVINAFKTYYSSASEDVVKPFLLTMIWDFENTGYGPHRTNNYLSSASNIKLITKAFESVAFNNIEAGFYTFKKIEGLGISYFSKLMYFAGSAVDLTDYPLIFDIRVANGLVHIYSNGTLNNIVDTSDLSRPFP